MQVDREIDQTDMDDGRTELILCLLNDLTGISIPIQKKMMVFSRLRKRLTELGNPSIPNYVGQVKCDPREQQIFINLLTTNETSFFRTPRIWQYFREEFLREFQQAASSETLKIWSAAAATGEEAFSIAMTCHDIQLAQRSFRYQVLATDIDTQVLVRAETGCYGEKNVGKLRESHPELFCRHFRQNDPASYQIDDQLRRSIRFMRHNLMERPKSPTLHHIVFLRNVLIYFREAQQIKILENISHAMAENAILVLGESESISALTTPFRFELPQIYRKLA